MNKYSTGLVKYKFRLLEFEIIIFRASSEFTISSLSEIISKISPFTSFMEFANSLWSK
uniref:Uncharacterized protein n=1 Tax=Cryptosporidium parvum TaxID=5807 RepID=F0X5N3_CRYPV